MRCLEGKSDLGLSSQVPKLASLTACSPARSLSIYGLFAIRNLTERYILINLTGRLFIVWLDTDSFVNIVEQAQNGIDTVSWIQTFAPLSLTHEIQKIVAQIASEFDYLCYTLCEAGQDWRLRFGLALLE